MWHVKENQMTFSTGSAGQQISPDSPLCWKQKGGNQASKIILHHVGNKNYTPNHQELYSINKHQELYSIMLETKKGKGGNQASKIILHAGKKKLGTKHQELTEYRHCIVYSDSQAHDMS